MSKVICGVCSNQSEGFCGFKKSKVKLNKRRICDRFRKDVEKVGFKQPIPKTRRPDWLWMTKKERKQLLQNMLVAAQRQAAEKQIVGAKNTQHPLTGDLGRFTTTATKEEKETCNDE